MIPAHVCLQFRTVSAKRRVAPRTGIHPSTRSASMPAVCVASLLRSWHHREHSELICTCLHQLKHLCGAQVRTMHSHTPCVPIGSYPKAQSEADNHSPRLGLSHTKQLMRRWPCNPAPTGIPCPLSGRPCPLQLHMVTHEPHACQWHSKSTFHLQAHALAHRQAAAYRESASDAN